MNIRIRKNFSQDLLKSDGVYSFLNFSSVGHYLNSEDKNIGIEFFCDGMLLSGLVSLLSGKKISRVSFDFTSIAHQVLNYAESNRLGVIFIGATDLEAKAFERKIKIKYPDLDVEATSGYFDTNSLEQIKVKLASNRFKFVVAGLGAPKQDYFISLLSAEYPNKTYFTCGGFIRQESNHQHEHYYPLLVEKTKTRAFYRMYREPHTIKRYIFDYPKNIFQIVMLSFRCKVFSVIEK